MCQGQLYARKLAVCVIVGTLSGMTTQTVGTPTANDDGEVSTWIPDDRSFGARLALVRWRMQWNMKEAAAECGVSPATWRLWEIEGALPRDMVGTGRKIARRTKCDLGWLIDIPELRGASAIAPYLSLTEQPTSKPHHPHGNRPNGHPPASRPPGVRRTVSVQRAGMRKAA